MALPLDEVRRTARRAGFEEIYLNDSSRVVSFARDETRVNVYYTTGTVGTCVHHPRQGKTQLFRRNVDLQLLVAIMTNPRVHTDRGYQRRPSHTEGSSGSAASPTKMMRAEAWGGAQAAAPSDPVGDEENEVLAYLSQLQAEKAALEQEIANVQSFADVYAQKRAAEAERQRLEQERRRREEAQRKWQEEERVRAVAAAAAEAEKRRKREARGVACAMRLQPKSLDHVHSAQQLHETCTCLALSGDDDVAIMLYEDGRWSFTAGLPTQLYNKLHGRATHHPSPTYVSLGTQNRYYIKFSNGKGELVGPNSLITKLHEEYWRDVASVAFGEDWDTWFIVFTDGYWGCNGHVPSALTDVIKSRNCRADLEFVSLGPNGEYCMVAQNGSRWWRGSSEAFSKDTCGLENRVRRIYFGANSSYVTRYT